MSSWCPPLFDQSPQRVTKRFFLYASDGVSDLLRSKFRVAGYVTKDYHYMAHMAWLIGGSSSAQALIRQVKPVKDSWDAGDDDKALSLTKVGALHMISVWFRTIEPAADARGKAREAAATSMASVVNQLLCTGDEAKARTACDVRRFLDMDLQWNRENDITEQPFVYAVLLLSRALEACGGQCVDWDRVVFPVQSLRQLLDGGLIVEPHVVDTMQTMSGVLECMEEGVRAMRRYHHMNIEGKIEPAQGVP